MTANISAVLKNHDFVYEEPPVEWESCIPLANGSIGTTIWGDGFPLKVSLDKYDIWETRWQEMDRKKFKYEYLRNTGKQGGAQKLQTILDKINADERDARKGTFHPTKLPLATMEILFKKDSPSLKGRLRLWDAFFEGNIVNAFVCSHKNVIAIKVPQGKNVRSIALKAVPLDGFGYPSPEQGKHKGISFFTQEYSKNREYTIAWRFLKASNLLYVTIVSLQEERADTLEAACAVLKEAIKDGYTKLLKNHRDYWKEFWSKSRISIPDSRMENFYYAEMYKLGCSSRCGSYPITLQALWTLPLGMPPWYGDYHLDMNVEASYWPIYASNHLECGEPLYRMFFGNLDFCKALGKKFYDKDIPLFMCAVGPGCEPMTFYYLPVMVNPGNGAWMSHLFWLHWLYSRDKDFLKARTFPFMRECMNTYLHIMEKSKDGKYHIPFSNTPEYFEGAATAWTDDNTYDLALVKFLVNALLESEKILKKRDPLHKTWVDVRKNLVDYCQDEKHGLMLAKGVRLENSHRHHSHLIGIYPLGHLNPDDSTQTRELIDKSIKHLFTLGSSWWAGFSWSWGSSIAGRAGYPEMANQYLQNYMDAFITNNTFNVNGDYKHKGFCCFDYRPVTLEAGFAAAAAILELLIQSHGGVIKLFPGAIYWPAACFENMRAEGAFLISALKKDGKVRWVKIYSEKGGLCRIEDPFADKKKIVEIRTQPGKTYRLGKVSEAKDIGKFDSRTNWFGVKQTPRF